MAPNTGIKRPAQTPQMGSVALFSLADLEWRGNAYIRLSGDSLESDVFFYHVDSMV